jgi:hypothetical protein
MWRRKPKVPGLGPLIRASQRQRRSWVTPPRARRRRQAQQQAASASAASEQRDNALRIKRNGVGVAAEVADLSPLDLRKLFTQATSSTWVRQNLATMKGIFQAAETAKPSIQIIKSVLPTSP